MVVDTDMTTTKQMEQGFTCQADGFPQYPRHQGPWSPNVFQANATYVSLLITPTRQEENWTHFTIWKFSGADNNDYSKSVAIENSISATEK